MFVLQVRLLLACGYACLYIFYVVAHKLIVLLECVLIFPSLVFSFLLIFVLRPAHEGGVFWWIFDDKQPAVRSAIC